VLKYGGLFSGSIFYTPFNSINRLGISKGYMRDGVRVSAGIKITPVSPNNFSLVPEFGFILHPIRLIGKDPYSFDIVLSYHQSDSPKVLDLVYHFPSNTVITLGYDIYI
jgi:hypothetical protein